VYSLEISVLDVPPFKNVNENPLSVIPTVSVPVPLVQSSKVTISQLLELCHVFPMTTELLVPVNASTWVPVFPLDVTAHDPLKLRFPSEPAVNDIDPEP
jgi:hypothetical protein